MSTSRRRSGSVALALGESETRCEHSAEKDAQASICDCFDFERADHFQHLYEWVRPGGSDV